MPLFRDARPQIIADINTKNGIVLKMADVVFGRAEPVASLPVQPPTTKKTRVMLFAAPAAPYTGSVAVYYDRLNFATVFAHTPLNAYANLRSFRPTRIHDLIPDLNNYYGLELTPADIEDGDLVLDNGNGTAVIKAKPGSLNWEGEFTVTITPGDLNLERAMTVTDLSGVQYPSGQSVKGQAEVYSYYFDCSSFAPYLSELVVPEKGEPVNQGFVDFVQSVTGDDWVLDGAVPFSLQGAKIVYNGVNSLNKPSNSNYNFICEVLLSDACTNFAGTLRFHYNVEANIDAMVTSTEMTVDHVLMSAYDPELSGNASYQTNGRYNPYLATAYNDYTPSANVLKTIPWQSTWTNASNANATALANALKAVDGLPWTMVSSNPNAEYNLYAVYVSYNGPVKNAPTQLNIEPRDGFTHVMYFNPPYQQQSNLWYGVGVVYYNV